MKNDVKEKFKKWLKAVGLYKTAVYVYSGIQVLYLKGKDRVRNLYSPISNAAFMKQNVSDGLPFPPVQLVYLVTNTYSYEWFYKTGIVGSQCIRGILEKNALDINAFESILDFGCGCGRVMRHWKTLNGPRLYGTDYNPALVTWCRKNLPFAEFSVNNSASKLAYEDEMFDFIYAISVFTHLTEDLGRFWMKELNRVLKPGGVVYVTFMGTTRAPNLDSELRERFEVGHLVITGKDQSGTNSCAAYHPEKYVREILARPLRTLEFVPGGAKDANQDVFLLQK